MAYGALAVKEAGFAGMMVNRIGRRIALALAALAGASAASAQPAAPRPAIWVIEDSDTRIYLFGTVHVFPAALRWRSAALNRIIAEAGELVMETPEAGADEIDPARLTRPMQLGKSVPILERVSSAAREPLRQALAATGVPIATYDAMTTWGVAFMLVGLQMRAASGNADTPPADAPSLGRTSGAEDVLGGLFRKAGKPISGVETVDEQIRFFSSLPLDAQRRFLESIVLGTDAGQVDAPDQSWVRGDVDGIAAEMRTMPPEIYRTLLTARNRVWTDWLVRRMARPGAILFAVGAGHLAGPDSVQSMLAGRGVRARRID